jgi:uncharacterized protein YebE (UPF0316 family)
MIYLLMALVQISYVALNSFRVVLMIKGKKYLAGLISTLEIFIYITGLSLLLSNAESTFGLVIYSVSYGAGIVLGIYIEQRVALGFITLHVISESGEDMALASQLREKGYGVTSWIGKGAEGSRGIYLILAKRKEYNDLKVSILALDPKAFIISNEPMNFAGGFWAKKLN